MSAPRSLAAETAERDAATVLEALLDLGTAASVPVTGSSMSPAVVAGDRAQVAPFLGLPAPGQVALARIEGRLVVHRIVSIDRRGGRRVYRLQGDAEPGPDAPVLREDLLGRVVAVLRDGRRIELDDSPAAWRRALRRLALRRLRRRLLRGAALAAAAAILAWGSLSAGSQEETLAPAPDYRFGAGDVLSLRVWDGQRTDEIRLTVQTDGEAFLPIKGIGALAVGGRTVTEVKQEIQSRLKAIYRETVIELLVTRYAGHKVSLMGEVRTTSRTDSGPGEWALQGPTRLVAFLSTHGGPGENADLGRILLIRRNAERRELNLFRAVFQGAPEDDPLLDAGDLVFVPSLAMGNRKVFVLGEVGQPGVLTFLNSMGLVEAVARAGGFTRMGYMKGVVLLRRGENGVPEMHIANFKKMVKGGGLAADLPLQPGDIVFVPRRALATVQEVFSIINPALAVIQSVYIIDSFRKD